MMKNDTRSDRYVKLFLRFSDSVEKIMRRVLFILIGLLLLFQSLLSFPPIRERLSPVDRLGGDPFPPIDRYEERKAEKLQGI